MTEHSHHRRQSQHRCKRCGDHAQVQQTIGEPGESLSTPLGAGAERGRVFQDGSSTSPLAGVQTVNVPVGGGSNFELRLRQPGDYPFVTHAFADATKGAVGVLRALAPGEKSSPQAGAMGH